MHPVIQALLTIGAIAVLGWAIIPFFVKKTPRQPKMTPVELSKFVLYQPGELVELTEYAVDVLGRVLIEALQKQYGERLIFRVGAIGEADEMLRDSHPQVLYLEGKRDGMPVLQLIGGRKGGRFERVRFHGSMVRKYQRTTFLATRDGKLTMCAR